MESPDHADAVVPSAAVVNRFSAAGTPDTMTVAPWLSTDPGYLGGRYQLDAPLGRGGMADVYRAHDAVLDRDVAVKIFHQAAALPDADLRRSAEVRLLASLSHPGLVALYDAGHDTSDVARPFGYLVMELVEGSTLAHWVASGPLPPTQVAAVAAQIAGALAYVHERGVVHRDVKPANVLVSGAPGPDDKPVAKLTDFGVARLVDGRRLTVEGTTVGTANYLSPEQAAGEAVGTASDVYSLGLVVLECLTGEAAFPGTGVEAALARLSRSPAIPQWLPTDWYELLTDMTADDPADRPAAGEAARRFASLGPVDEATDLLRSLMPLGAGAAEPVGSSRAAWWLTGAAAAAVAALLVLVSGIGRGGHDEPTALAAASTPGSSAPATASPTPSSLSPRVPVTTVGGPAHHRTRTTARPAARIVNVSVSHHPHTAAPHPRVTHARAAHSRPSAPPTKHVRPGSSPTPRVAKHHHSGPGNSGHHKKTPPGLGKGHGHVGKPHRLPHGGGPAPKAVGH